MGEIIPRSRGELATTLKDLIRMLPQSKYPRHYQDLMLLLAVVEGSRDLPPLKLRGGRPNEPDHD